MKSQKPLTNKEGEVRELTKEDFDNGKSFSDLPISLQDKLRTRGQQKSPIKQSITIRLSVDVVEHFKSLGKGWQTRIDGVLKKHIESK